MVNPYVRVCLYWPVPRSIYCLIQYCFNCRPRNFQPIQHLFDDNYLAIIRLKSRTRNSKDIFQQSADKYAFWMSHANKSRSFKVKNFREILIESLDTTNEYVIVESTSIVFPPATYISFHLKMSPCFISKIT